MIAAPTFRRATALWVLVLSILAFPVSGHASVQRGFTPSPSLRVVDTRIDADGPALEAGQTRTVHLISRVPLGATAVELNVTALDASEDTSLTVWPSGQARPYTSVLNVGPGRLRSNSVLVELGDLYAVDIYNSAGSVDVVIDVNGWFTGDFAGMRPMRMVDTRFGYGAATLRSGADQSVAIGGRFGVPLDAKAVAMNITAIGATEPASIVAWPSGTDKPLAGVMQAPAGAIHDQSAIVGLNNGSVSLATTAGSVDIVVDVTGWFRADGRFTPNAPRRVVDTAVETCGVALGPGETRTFPVTDSPDVFAVAVNVSAKDASETTYLSVWEAGGPQPSTSNLNVMPGPDPVGTAVITELGPGGQISLFNAVGTVHVTLDVIGIFSGTTPAGQATPCPMPPPPPPPPPPPAPAAAPTTTKPPVSWQTTMLNAINSQRSEAGLSPVSSCGSLSRTAQAYADVLVGTRGISHTGPDGSTLRDRVGAQGYLGWSVIGENLAAGQETVDIVMAQWMESPGHRANILKPEFTHVGFGRTKGYYQNNTVESWFWVQNFGAGGSC